MSCRAHARRRHRLALAPARPDDRQPALGGPRDGRRSARHRLRRASTRTSSGACAAAPATSASSSRSSTGCTRSARSSSAGRSCTTLDDAPAALRNARDFFVDAPDEVSLWLALTHVPPAASVPGGALGHAGARRRPVLHRPRARPGAARAAHVVRLADREPARADPVHGAAVRARRGRPARPPLLGTGRLPRRASPTARSTRSSKARRTASSKLTEILVFPMGGAIARVPADATAFGDRTAPWAVWVASQWTDPAEDAIHRDWTRGVLGLARPVDDRRRLRQRDRRRRDRGAQAGGLRRAGEATSGCASSSAPGIPSNLFRLNHNIAP